MTKMHVWSETTVGEQFQVQLGKMLDAAKNSGESKLYVGNRAVQWGHIDLNAAGVVPLTRADQARFKLRTGDLLVCEGGEVGRAAIWEHEHIECYYQKALHRLRTKRGYDPSVLKALLEYRAKSEGFADYVTQTSIAHLPREKLLQLPIPAIPTGEQSRIKEVLDNVESEARALEKLIAKKRAIKQGMIQELLTGRTRLPGFDGEWHAVTLGEHVRYVKTVALSRAQLNATSPTRYLHYGDIHTRGDSVLDTSVEMMPRVSKDLLGNAGYLQKGDLVFADASEDPDGVGKSVEITGVPSEGVVPGLHTIAARFDKRVLADGFKGYLQFIDAFRSQLLALASGTKVLATTRSYISRIELTLPGIAEQVAISEILRDADAEIEALERRLEATRDIKQGMMQELLTGLTRLPVDEGVTV